MVNDMNYEIIDNYLPKDKHAALVGMIENREFEWYFIKGIITANDGSYMFNHRFYNSDNGAIQESKWFTMVNELLLTSLNYTKLFRVKCNLYTQQKSLSIFQFSIAIICINVVNRSFMKKGMIGMP